MGYNICKITKAFCGYGILVQNEELVRDYLGFFEENERDSIYQDRHIFVHYLNYETLVIGFRGGSWITKETLQWSVEKFVKDFDANWVENFGDLPRLAEPYFRYFLYNC